MDGDAALRDALLTGSDSRTIRAVRKAHTAGESMPVVATIEAMRATGGDVSLHARDDTADVYARWADGRFETLVVYPSWSISGPDHRNRNALASFLADRQTLRPVPKRRRSTPPRR